MSFYSLMPEIINLQSCYSTSRSDLSKSSTSLASKTTWYGTMDSSDPILDPILLLTDSDSQSESDHEESRSIDSFYEKAFEAVEQLQGLLDSDWCRDSAIFSDRDDTTSTTPVASASASSASSAAASLPTTTIAPSLPQEAAKQPLHPASPPPIPAKSQWVVQQQQVQHSRNRGLAILERMRCLEQNARSDYPVASAASLENLKSISQRRLELTQATGVKTGDESETSSTSTINTVVELHPAAVAAAAAAAAADETCNRRTEDPGDVLHASGMGPLPKGWVKHIIGKLQGDTK